MTTECVFIDAVRTANARAHKDKGWFRNVRPDELLTAVYAALYYPQEKYGLAALCGGFGNANAVLIEKVDRS